MIQPLRTFHRRVFIGLAFLLPTIFIAALTGRHVWPAASPSPQKSFGKLLISESGHWQSHQIEIRIYTSENAPALMQLLPQRDITEPDLLVYCSAQAAGGSSLASNSHLLGQLAPGALYSLPDELSAGGFLTLFSPALGKIIDTTSFGARP